MSAFSSIELLIILAGLLATVFWIWALVDCVQNRASLGEKWLIWLVVIAVTHVLGAILYVLLYKLRFSSPR